MWWTAWDRDMPEDGWVAGKTVGGSSQPMIDMAAARRDMRLHELEWQIEKRKRDAGWGR